MSHGTGMCTESCRMVQASKLLVQALQKLFGFAEAFRRSKVATTFQPWESSQSRDRRCESSGDLDAYGLETKVFCTRTPANSHQGHVAVELLLCASGSRFDRQSASVSSDVGPDHLGRQLEVELEVPVDRVKASSDQHRPRLGSDQHQPRLCTQFHCHHASSAWKCMVAIPLPPCNGKANSSGVRPKNCILLDLGQPCQANPSITHFLSDL